MPCSANISNQSLIKAAEQFGTPLYVYDSHLIAKHYRQLKESFANRVDIFYSLKANPNLAISARLKKLAAGAEVCSGVELKTALLAGYSPKDIIFVGPVKKEADIVAALKYRIYAIVCESKEEFVMINELAKTRSEVANIAIRVNPVFSVRGASLKMGGAPSQFGIDQEQLFQEKTFFLGKKHVNIRGIHVFNSSRILNVETFVENIKKILTLADDLAKAWNKSFSMLDIGGGIGVPYFNNENPFDLLMLQKLIKPLIQSQKNKRIILESGRYLMANAGVFVSRIENVKKSQQVQFLLTDGGMNCHLTAAGYGSLLKRNFPIKLLTYKKKSTARHKYHITGPLCTPADIIGRDVELPEAKIGDYVAILASGAYGPTASPVLFLGHGHPAEVLSEDGQMRLVRERDSISDFLRKQKFL